MEFWLQLKDVCRVWATVFQGFRANWKVWGDRAVRLQGMVEVYAVITRNVHDRNDVLKELVVLTSLPQALNSKPQNLNS